jgi:hypothetical protein
MFRKLLSDYPFRKWVKAADKCEFCGAEYEARVTYVDKSGCYGDVEYRVRHREDCPERFDEDTGEELDCAESTFDVAGWEYSDKPVELRGRQFYPLKARSNVGPCLNCGRLVIGVSLILFIDEGRGGELDFCKRCFEDLGLVNRFKPKPAIEIEVTGWKYAKPPWIPEGATEYVHLCGCRDVLKEDGVWYGEQCSKHKAETDQLVDKIRKQLSKEGLL